MGRLSTPGLGGCPSRGRLRAGPGVCRSLTLAELGACDWRGWCCRQQGRLQSPCSACLHRVAGCRPVESAEDLGAVRCGPVLSGRKFQSHPGVPPGRLLELASSSARVGMWSWCRCSGVSNPIRIPERRAAGWVWGRPPPTCAGSSRWVPSLEGLGLAKTARCLPRHVVRVVGAPTRSQWFLLAPEPQGASGCGATDVPQGCMAAWCSPGTSTIGFGLGRMGRRARVT